MTNREYEYWVKNLEHNVSTRTNLLTFAFTTVLAVLGLALSVDNDTINVIAFLVPYFLIIPFEGRIAYYRIIHARISAYLEVVIPADRSLDIIGVAVPEKQSNFFNIIVLLNNYEMFFLSCATALVFYSKYPVSLQAFQMKDYFLCLIPLVLSAFVLLIVAYAFNYDRWKKKYKDKWKQKYKNK